MRLLLAHHALDDHVHPDQTDQRNQGEEHPVGVPYPGALQQVAEDDRTDEPAQAAQNSYGTAHYAHFGGKVFRNVFIDRGLADSQHDANEKHQAREDPDIRLKVDAGDASGQKLPFGDLVPHFDSGFVPRR